MWGGIDEVDFVEMEKEFTKTRNADYCNTLNKLSLIEVLEWNKDFLIASVFGGFDDVDYATYGLRMTI